MSLKTLSTEIAAAMNRCHRLGELSEIQKQAMWLPPNEKPADRLKREAKLAAIAREQDRLNDQNFYFAERWGVPWPGYKEL